MNRLPFFSDCVDWPKQQGAALMYLVDNGREITRETFVRHTGDNPNPAMRGQFGWFRPYGYHYFALPGFAVYWYTWSAIEFVYATPDTIRRLHEHAVRETAKP